MKNRGLSSRIEILFKDWRKEWGPFEPVKIEAILEALQADGWSVDRTAVRNACWRLVSLGRLSKPMMNRYSLPEEGPEPMCNGEVKNALRDLIAAQERAKPILERLAQLWDL